MSVALLTTACSPATPASRSTAASGESGARQAADRNDAPLAGSALLLVTLDTVRRDALGFAGGAAAAATPNFDALAAAGVVMDRAWSVAPITLPAHASLFTGLLPAVHGIRDNLGFRLPAAFETLAERLAIAGYDCAASVGARVVAAPCGLEQGFAAFDQPDAAHGVEERPAGAVTRGALAQLARFAAARAPFFEWVHFYDAHAPYDDRAAPGSPRRAYLAEVERIDRQFGRLLVAARAAAGARPLAIVVVADHGEALGDHREAAHGHLLHEATLRVPWIFAHPRFAPGRTRWIASSIDLVPTLLEALGLGDRGELQGRSLLAPLLDPALRDAAPPRTIVFESRLPWHEFGWPWLDGACDGRFKWVDRPKAALFDLDADPAESLDASDDHPEIVASLRAAVATATRGDATASARPSALTGLGYVAARRLAPADKESLPEPGDRFALLQLRDEGLEAIAAGATERALACFAQLRARNPDPAPAALLSAVALSRAAESLPDGADRVSALERAEAAWSEAIALAPNDALRRFNRAQTLLELGRRDAAIDELARCVELAPDDAAARAALAAARAAQAR